MSDVLLLSLASLASLSDGGLRTYLPGEKSSISGASLSEPEII